LTFAGPFSKETFVAERSVEFNQESQIVIICLSCWPASKLMKFDGESRFRIEVD